MLRIPQKKADRVTQGPVTYLDGAPLKRPFQMPLIFRVVLLLFVAAAVVMGVMAFRTVYDKVIEAPLREAKDMEYHITKDVDVSLPVLVNFIGLDDETISTQLSEAGYTIVSLKEDDDSENSGVDLVKLPDDISNIEAGLMYTQIGSLSSTEAVRLLNGSWRLTISRSGSHEMNVKYADFSSEGIDAAIDKALLAEGFFELPVAESGVDAAGNTYRKGQIDVGGTYYNWQVSACPLSDVYSISGLPETSSYVGIKVFF